MQKLKLNYKNFNKKTPFEKVLFLILDVQKSKNVFVNDHENQVNDPNEAAEENTKKSCNNLSFLESCNSATKPSGERNDCKNQAYNPVKTKVI